MTDTIKKPRGRSGGAPRGNTNRAGKLAPKARRATVQARITEQEHAALTSIATSKNLTVAELLALIANGDALVILVPDDDWHTEQFAADVRALAAGNESIELLANALDEARGRRDGGPPDEP